MQFLQKYLLLFFLIANTTAEYIMFMSISKILFYSVLIISIFFIFRRQVFSSESYSMCPDIYLLGIILLGYELLFGTEHPTTDSLVYLAGKLASFAIIMLCVVTDFDFYLKKIIIPFSIFVLILLAVGWIHNRTFSSSSNYLVFGFANRNAACTLASISFAGFLFGRISYSKWDYAAMAFLLITILIGGSRNSLAMCAIFIMIRFGLSWELVLTTLGLIIIILYVLPEMGVRIDAFDRLIGTFTGEVQLDRENQRLGAMMMIDEKPWTGWGLASQLQGRALAISHYGAHNGYLTFLMYMGIPLGIVYILTLLWGVIKRLKLYFLNDNIIKYHIAVMVAIIFAANQEDYLVGVNQITTNIFYFSFVVSGIYLYYYKNDIPIYLSDNSYNSNDQFESNDSSNKEII